MERGFHGCGQRAFGNPPHRRTLDGDRDPFFQPFGGGPHRARHAEPTQHATRVSVGPARDVRDRTEFRFDAERLPARGKQRTGDLFLAALEEELDLALQRRKELARAGQELEARVTQLGDSRLIRRIVHLAVPVNHHANHGNSHLHSGSDRGVTISARPLTTRRRARRVALLGPAFIAAIAYVDPGNVATNVTAGSHFGYTLVWVIVLANVMAVVVQYLSAKLGIVTGMSLAEHMGQRLPPPARLAYWLQAEAIVMATDLAEVVGGAIALYLIFDVPLLLGAVITVIVSLAVILIGDFWGQSALERTTMGFLALIAVGFTAGLFVDPPEGHRLASGLIPSFQGPESLLLASGMVGATVMPHVIYLHSSLTTTRLGSRGEHHSLPYLLVVTRSDVTAALVVAGALNLSLLVVSASSLEGLSGTDTLQGVHAVITSQLGTGVALLFAVALLGSGLASTAVGAAAGAEVMNGLLHRSIPLLVRRGLTALPAIVVLALGAEPTRALVVSQVILSLGIPFALVPLVVLTATKAVMGVHANRPALTAAATLVATIVIALNVALLYLTFF